MTTRKEAIADRLAAATPGPWRRHDYRGDRGPVHYNVHEPPKPTPTEVTWLCTLSRREDAVLIANAPADLAYLLEENARLRQQVDDLERRL